MKKKWELLKYAYDNYPKGAKFKSPYSKVEAISDGIFNFDEDGSVSTLGMNVYYSVEDKWAEIIVNDGMGENAKSPVSILSGKCAIQVNNEREFKLLMEHYESKGWNPLSKCPIEELIRLNTPKPFLTWGYENEFCALRTLHEQEGYKIIPFSDFAAEVGIKVPVFVLRSEDGVDLYEGDEITLVWEKVKGSGKYGSSNSTIESKCEYTSMVFSSREAAEEWIKDQNKPKEITLFKDGSNNPYAVLTKNVVDFTKPGDNHIYRFTSDELKQIWEAHQSLL